MNKKQFLPIVSVAVIFVASLIILWTPLRPKIYTVTPNLKINQSWLTYYDDNLGIQFDYPSTEEVVVWDQEQNILCIKKKAVSDGPALCKYVQKYSNPNNLSLLNFILTTEYKDLPWTKTDLLGQYEAIKTDADFFVLSPDQNTVIRLSFSGISDEEKHILSTFKFTDAN